MKAFSILVLTAFLFPVSVFSQYTLGGSNGSTVSTRYQTGYVVLPSDEKLQGKIQLKIDDGDTVKISIKTFDKKKYKYTRNEIKSFGLELTRADFKREDFNPGQITLVDGTVKEGNVVVIKTAINKPMTNPNSSARMSSSGAETSGLGEYTAPPQKLKCPTTKMPDNTDHYTGKWSYKTVYFEDENGKVTPYYASHIWKVTQTRGDKTLEWNRYALDLLPIVEKGKFNLIRDPYPEVYSKEKTEAAQKKQSKAAKTISNDKQSITSARNQIAVDMATQKVAPQYDDEWIIIDENGVAFELNSKSFKGWMDRNANYCNAYNERSNKLQLNKYSEVRKIVEFLNENCSQ